MTPKGKHKTFDKKLHAAHDPQSREIIKKYYKDKWGIILIDGKTRYSVDLMSEDESMQLELEHRTNWKEPIFKFPDINVPQRKFKFFKDGTVDYVILSEDYSHIGIIKGKDIKKYMVDDCLKECRNKHFFTGELFYKIPKDSFTWIKL
jgi:hypothetical protein